MWFLTFFASRLLVLIRKIDAPPFYNNTQLISIYKLLCNIMLKYEMIIYENDYFLVFLYNLIFLFIFEDFNLDMAVLPLCNSLAPHSLETVY